MQSAYVVNYNRDRALGWVTLEMEITLRNERVYVTFVGQKKQCPQIYTKLTQFEESFPENITY